jgi:hypothetical protein
MLGGIQWLSPPVWRPGSFVPVAPVQVNHGGLTESKVVYLRRRDNLVMYEEFVSIICPVRLILLINL